MGRRPQPEIRQRLLEACTDLALAQGLPDRLEPFVRATGVSARMLLYHFGTRDALLREVLRHARTRQREAYGRWLRPREGVPYPDVLLEAWAGISGEAGRGYLRVFGRLRQDEEQRLWPGFPVEATTDWLQPLGEGLATVGRPELATLALAVIRGLVLDLEATADTARVDAAWAHFVDGLRGAAPPG